MPFLSAAHQANNYKGSIYMVFDYMDHDLTGLMQRRGYKLPVDQVHIAWPLVLQFLSLSVSPAAANLATPYNVEWCF